MRVRSAFCYITPRGRPAQLAGYAGRPPATELLDKSSSAVLHEDGERRCLIFSFDLMGVGAELQAKDHFEKLGFSKVDTDTDGATTWRLVVSDYHDKDLPMKIEAAAAESASAA